LIKGNKPENIKFGSTLARDEFGSMRFDFMLSNPPYGSLGNPTKAILLKTRK